MAERKEQITQLYRHYDANGRLLYVGISLNVMNRSAVHESTSAWFLEVVRIDIEHYPSRDEAMRAERSAIRRENPKHNVVHQPGPVIPPLKYAPMISYPPVPMRNAAQQVASTTPQSFTIKEFCDAYRISRGGFYLLQKNGQAPATFKIGRHIRISEKSVQDWLAARELEGCAA